MPIPAARSDDRPREKLCIWVPEDSDVSCSSHFLLNLLFCLSCGGTRREGLLCRDFAGWSVRAGLPLDVRMLRQSIGTARHNLQRMIKYRVLSMTLGL